MAKRWIIQKRLKTKVFRERKRGVMKRFSCERVKTGSSSSNDEAIRWFKNSSVSIRNGYVSDKELTYYNSNLPRQEALDLRDKMKNTRPEWMYFRLVDDGFLRARMYFQHNPERCAIVELDKRNNRLRRSIVFRNRDVCYQRWLDNSIVWVDMLYHENIPETFPTEGDGNGKSDASSKEEITAKDRSGNPQEETSDQSSAASEANIKEGYHPW